jgi:predicted amidohydrolase
MRVLLGQLTPRPGAVDVNTAALVDALAGHPDADLAVFPELYLCGYDPSRAAALALEPGDPPFATIAAAARELGSAVIVGYAERTERGTANAVACIDADGSWAGSYRKTHLFGSTEMEAFVPGEHLRVARLAGHLVGLLVCFDVEFPEPARALARAGAELLVTVAANMEPDGPDHALAVRARALDNRTPHIYVNRCGEEAGHRFTGESTVVAAGGHVLAALGSEPTLLAVDLELAASTRADVDYLRWLRDSLPVEGPVPASIQGGEFR